MIELKVQKRDLTESNDFLRSQGLIPAEVYGNNFENISLSIADTDLRRVYRQTGTSQVISLTGVEGLDMCIIQTLQVHVVTGDILHADLKVVSEGEVTEVTIPLTLVGEAPAHKNGIGLINFSLEEIIIETTPRNIPKSIEVDISGLEHLGDHVKLSDLKFAKEIKVLDDMDTTIVSIVAPREEEPEEESTEDVVMEPELVDQKGKAKEEDTEEDA